MGDFDIWKTLKGVVSTGAPILANAIIPGSGGVAAALIGGILGVDPNSPEKMAEALKNADPAVWAQLREAEMKHEAKLLELGIKNDEMYLDDIKDARQREVNITKSGGTNAPMYWLAGLIVGGFFLLMGVLVFRETAIPAGSREIAFILVGSLASNFGQVCQYFFGSSKGSNEKNKIIQHLQHGTTK